MYEKCHEGDLHFLLCKHRLFLWHFPQCLLFYWLQHLSFFPNVVLRLLDKPGL